MSEVKKPEVKKQIIKIPIKDGKTKKPLIMMKYMGKFTRKDIRNTVQALSNELKKKNFEGAIATNIYYGKDEPIKWGFSPHWTDPGSKINLFDYRDYESNYDEPGSYSEFRVFVRNFN
jgi:hypothetical protein